ncbi:hypothetical protein BHM03_00017326 [Ensete ventricosum]|nr:hypothetical protein BHM03_00017326 [Ensete ventricosum]
MTSSLIPPSPCLPLFPKRRRKIKKKVAPCVPRGRIYREKRDVRQRGSVAIWTVKTYAQSPPSHALGEQRSDRSRPIHPEAASTLRGEMNGDGCTAPGRARRSDGRELPVSKIVGAVGSIDEERFYGLITNYPL